MGRPLALQSLAGRPAHRAPVALFTWGFDYIFKLAGLAPWQLAFGGHETWHRAHMAIVDCHHPDIVFYDGAGSGPLDATLLRETREAWYARDNNTGAEHELLKDSLAARELATGRKICDPVGGVIRAIADVERLITPGGVHGQAYLDGLARLIRDVGERALVMPHDSPAYIVACYALGFEPAMQMMLEAPEVFAAACARCDAGARRRMRQLAEAGAEAVFIADSWASCDIISPALFERFALPYQRSIVEAAREAGLRVALWNPGDIRPILRHEAALPVDAFAWEQPRKGIDVPVRMVREVFGPDRCLWGNVDSELLLWRNDPDEIRAAVAEQFRQSGPGAPFALFQGSPIPSNVEPAAVETMIRAARAASEWLQSTDQSLQCNEG